jgi:hypothetical protein
MNTFVSRIGTLGVATLALVFALPAAASDYSFVIRGVVDVSVNTKVVNVTATKSSAKAVAETESKNIGYSISKAKVYKYVNGVRRLASKSAIKLGDEVVLKGKKVGGTFRVDELTINTRTFEMVGRVREIDTVLNTITIQVVHSTYREKGLKGTKLKLTYNDDTVCKRLGSTVGCSTIDISDNIIKVKGGVSGTNQVYDLSAVFGQYKK